MHFDKLPSLVDLNELKTWIVFEDEKLIVINKPGWLVCHPSKNGDLSSLVGAVRVYLGLDRVYIINRLDRETSGLIVFAKHGDTASILQKAFGARSVKKEYLAILEGELIGQHIISQPLAKDENSKVFIKNRCAIDSAEAKESVSIFRPIVAKNKYTLTRVELVTGRKHQIRCHALWMNHRIVADKIYGHDDTLYIDFTENGFFNRCANVLPLQRQALHAWKLDFSSIMDYPSFTAPLSKELDDFILDKMDISVSEFLK